MIEIFEKMDKNTGYGFCIRNDGETINFYRIERWHPLLVKRISLEEKKIMIEESLL